MRFLVGLCAFTLALGCEGGDGGSPPETVLVVTIDYSSSSVDTLHVTGVALTNNRPFGPFDARGDKVRPGATIALIFDPSDAGTAMVCVEAREGSSTRAAACNMFAIAAGQTTRGELHLAGGD